MIVMRLVEFSNDYFAVLAFLNEQCKAKKDGRITMNQDRIAASVHFSKLKTNRIMQWLKRNEMIKYENDGGVYSVTSKGRNAIRMMNREIKKGE